jgi:hypothetical protein
MHPYDLAFVGRLMFLGPGLDFLGLLYLVSNDFVVNLDCHFGFLSRSDYPATVFGYREVVCVRRAIFLGFPFVGWETLPGGLLTAPAQRAVVSSVSYVTLSASSFHFFSNGDILPSLCIPKPGLPEFQIF